MSSMSGGNAPPKTLKRPRLWGNHKNMLVERGRGGGVFRDPPCEPARLCFSMASCVEGGGGRKRSARRRWSVLLVWLYGTTGRLWHGSSIVSPLLFRVGSCRFLRRLLSLSKVFLASPSPLQMLRGRTLMNVNSLEFETSRR